VKGLLHPFTRALYEQDGAGNVRVTHHGLTGIFSPDGRWLNGELRECDPQLAGWVAGPQLGSARLSPPTE
jgi:hypothetical protein